MLCHATVVLMQIHSHTTDTTVDTSVNTFTPTAFTPATTHTTNTLVLLVVTVDIAYYTTAYTPILLYSYHVHIDTIVLLSYTH